MWTLIDNYDSFTYNLYQALCKLGAEVRVVRNDVMTAAQAGEGSEGLILSPGPGTPADAGICAEAVRLFAGKLPILGVCLGHQTIGEVFGAKVVRAPQPIHGKVSKIRHNAKGMFAGMPQGLEVGRYHSLVLEASSIPDCLEVTATTEDGLIMAVQHKTYAVTGIQFHPESILTPQGEALLQKFLENHGTLRNAAAEKEQQAG